MGPQDDGRDNGGDSDDGGGASGNGPGGAGAKSNRRSRPHWVKLVSYRGMGADLANNAAMKPVLPLLAANPEISAAEVFKRTNVRVTDVELRDAAETLVHAATTFADLNAAGLQSVLAEHMKQTVDGASLADDAELAPSSSTAPLSSSIPFAGNGGAALQVSVGNSAVSAAASAAALAARGGGKGNGNGWLWQWR